MTSLIVAGLQDTRSASERVRLLPAYAGLTAEALLDRLRGECRRRFFPVPDPTETRRAKIDAIVHGEFEFNGEVHRLGARFDWLVNPSADVEWHILLHKFYYATGLSLAWNETHDDRYLQCWVSLTDAWIDTVPPGFIAADVTGRRVQNWLYAYHGFVGGGARIDVDFHERLLASLEQQVDYLCDNLTAKRNHRTLELYAIFLAGVALPELARATYWRRFALEQLVANIQADLLADGVHCELSTDYHHLVVKNYLCVRRLAAMNGLDVPAVFDERLSQALDFSMYVHKPDGIVPSLSDGDARGFLDLLAQGHELFGREDWLYVATRGERGVVPSRTTIAFDSAGYAVLRSGWGRRARPFSAEHYLVFDCGPLGEGNHGHFDCLSFELAAFGRSLVVDPGRYTYSEAGERNWRVHFRGTAAHNTVTVDGLNQTRYEPKRVASGTRHAQGSTRHRIAGPAPIASMPALDATSRFAYVRGSARSSEYPAVHTRDILFAFDEYWLVIDRLESSLEHCYDLRFQLGEHADGRVLERIAPDAHFFESPGLAIACTSEAGDHFAVDESWVSYDYGTKHRAPVVRTTRRARNTLFHTLLQPHAVGAAAPRLEMRVLRDADARERDAEPTGFARPTALEILRSTPSGLMRDVVVFGGAPAVERWAPHWTHGIDFRGDVLAMRFDDRGRLIESQQLGARSSAGAAT